MLVYVLLSRGFRSGSLRGKERKGNVTNCDKSESRIIASMKNADLIR